MYAPHQVPKGPHYVYIFHDPMRSWFKVGESRKPHQRRKDVIWKHYGRNSLGKLKEYRIWKFKNYYACIHVEQAIIDLLKAFGCSPVREPDWFEVDQVTMDAVIASIERLASAIGVWEEQNATLECDCTPGTPYGDYLADTDYITLNYDVRTRDGTIEYIEPELMKLLLKTKLHYDRIKSRRMPRGLEALIVAMERINKLNDQSRG